MTHRAAWCSGHVINSCSRSHVALNVLQRIVAVTCSYTVVSSPLRITTSNFFQLNTSFHIPYVTSSLTREWVCSLQLLLVLATAVILPSDSRGTRDHILLSQIRDSPNLEGQAPVFISPRNRAALSLTIGRVCRLPESQSAVISLLSLCTIYILHVTKCIYNIYKAFVSPVPLLLHVCPFPRKRVYRAVA
jgi:hypothetical protein